MIGMVLGFGDGYWKTLRGGNVGGSRVTGHLKMLAILGVEDVVEVLMKSEVWMKVRRVNCATS